MYREPGNSTATAAGNGGSAQPLDLFVPRVTTSGWSRLLKDQREIQSRLRVLTVWGGG